jgi:hypothetical protein
MPWKYEFILKIEMKSMIVDMFMIMISLLVHEKLLNQVIWSNNTSTSSRSVTYTFLTFIISQVDITTNSLNAHNTHTHACKCQKGFNILNIPKELVASINLMTGIFDRQAIQKKLVTSVRLMTRIFNRLAV